MGRGERQRCPQSATEKENRLRLLDRFRGETGERGCFAWPKQLCLKTRRRLLSQALSSKTANAVLQAVMAHIDGLLDDVEWVAAGLNKVGPATRRTTRKSAADEGRAFPN